MPSGFISLNNELGWRSLLGEHWDIISVQYGDNTEWQLLLQVEALDGTREEVTFTDVVSFRVHDEAEIHHYWVARENEGAAASRVYIIRDSTYLDEIATGVSGRSDGPLIHYLVAGENTCVEVIGRSPPALSFGWKGKTEGLP